MKKITAQFMVIDIFEGPGGGAIFYGKDGNDNEVTAALNYKKCIRIPAIDEIWYVEGHKKPYSKYPDTIHSDMAKPVLPPVGELTRRYLCKSRPFRGFGFGEKKLENLEKHLLKYNLSVHDALGNKMIDIISEVLSEGIAKKLVEAWGAASCDLEIFKFLDDHGFDVKLATFVHKHFKKNTVERIKNNPYRLIAFGTSTSNFWGKAEKVAKHLGIGSRDPRRLAAAVEQAFYQRLDDGHTLTDYDTLKAIVLKLLRSRSEKVFECALQHASVNKAVVKCDNGFQPLGPACMEAHIEYRLSRLARRDHKYNQMSLFSTYAINLESIIGDVDNNLRNNSGFRLNQKQREAVDAICSSSISVIYGGAGTGKTTILRAVQEICKRTFVSVHQMALAGRAKERLEEATGQRAFTIHAMCEMLEKREKSPNSKTNISIADDTLFVIDEASMVDLALLNRLLRYTPTNVKLCFVGDHGQLPPIGFGLIFHKLVHTNGIRKVELTEIVRQEEATGIPSISASIRDGIVPDIEDFDGMHDGVFFRPVEDISKIVPILFETSSSLNHECQLLTARRVFGVDSSNKINRHFQQQFTVNKANKGCLFKWQMYVNDPVIVTKNSYDLGLFNGAIGYLKKVENFVPVFNFRERDVQLNDEQMVTLGIQLAYGVTVHKAQGSEFDRVIVPVTKSKGLDRSLIYTALTRARKQVVFVGDRAVFEEAIIAEPRAFSLNVGFDMKYLLAA